MEKIDMSEIRIFMVLSMLCCISLHSCQSQSRPTVSEQELSNDFNQEPPIFYVMPENIDPVDTSYAWFNEKKQILISGTIYERDGKTPARDVLMYYYQTNSEGKYAHIPNVPESMPKNKQGATHGAVRGWIRTNKLGQYKIYTSIPGYYPKNPEAAHIHAYVVDPKASSPYYIDNFVFDYDPLLKGQLRKELENRGGSGIIRFVKHEGQLVGERDIILGLNIPDYPVEIEGSDVTGRQVGEELFSFMPYHAWGQDAGSKACPICKYGWFQGVLYFAGQNIDWQEIENWLVFLESESKRRTEFLNVHFVFADHDKSRAPNLIGKLQDLGSSLNIKNVALTVVPSFTDKESEIYLNEIDPNVSSTIILYQRNRIMAKFYNMEPHLENFDKLINILEASKSEFLELPRVDKIE